VSDDELITEHLRPSLPLSGLVLVTPPRA